ncbi:MAG: hypothetical protein HUU01_05025 [Saprospiraceae bacterium]|nr:hypothetical protein [Saprospiraceae bacterium]
MKKILFILPVLAFVTSCQDQQVSTTSSTDPATGAQPQFSSYSAAGGGATSLDKYWYQGKAEISHYALQQNRYKDIHEGEAVMIFVTEDFLTDKQVKNDQYQNPNSIPILKNNIVCKFPTGIYDYSMMTSVFTPVNTQKYPRTMKVTASSQEWCGHTFMQINDRDKGYAVSLRSYFEMEGDQDNVVAHTLLEDELFNRIRMNPSGLPSGKIKMLPGTMVARLMHKEFQPLDAEISVTPYDGREFTGSALQVCRVVYPTLDRTLEIVFEKEAPFIIAGWKDTYLSMFDKKMKSTIARRTNTLLDAYWSHNALSDQPMRKALGLTTFVK